MTNDVRAILQDKRAELVRSIRSQSSQLCVHDSESDLVDRMQSMSNRDQAVTLLDALTRTLAEIDIALAAVKDGSYGICLVCEEPIASKRLRTVPWASHCIRCQEALERRSTHAALSVWDEAA